MNRTRQDPNEQSPEVLLSDFAAFREERGKSLWLVAFQQRSVWTRSAKLGLSVGVLQAIINQADVWMAHEQTLGTLVKTIISPLVTFSVALVTAAATYVDKSKLNA